MNWYYAAGGEKAGPFTDENFASLVALGVVKGDTMVWHEGLANWQAYREIAASSEVAPEASGAMAACAQCGRSVPPAELTLWEGRRVCPDCAPVAAGVTRAEVADNRAVTIRREHLKHEAAVKFIGTAYILGGCLAVFAALLDLTGFGGPEAAANPYLIIEGLLIPGLFIAVGVALRRLLPWTYVPAGIVALFILQFFPLGTGFGLYTLVMMFSEKGRTVLGEDYRKVIASTPQVKIRTSFLFWFLVVFLLVGFVVLLFLLMRDGESGEL